MTWSFLLFAGSALLGLGLAMDAFSVSIANGLANPGMPRSKICTMAGVFAFFQALMPLLGWFCVHNLAERFAVFERFVPRIAFLLLGFIGINMLIEGIRKNEKTEGQDRLSAAVLLVQGIATSIDALSVGFTISEYELPQALACALVIAAVTFALCASGVLIGKKFGMALADKAQIFGGMILIGIGIEILLQGIL